MDQIVQAPEKVAVGQSDKPAQKVEKLRTVLPLSGRWAFFKYSQVAYIAAMIASIGLALATLDFFDDVERGAFASEAEIIAAGSAIDAVALPLGVAYIALFFVCALAYAMFYHRCMNNLHAEGARDATMSPGWVWGYFFIPFVNLVKPIEGIMQIWRGSAHLTGGDPKIPATIGWWWASWLGGNFVGTIASRMSDYSMDESGIENFELFKLSLQFELASNLIILICSLLLVRFTFQIKQAQQSIREGSVQEIFA